MDLQLSIQGSTGEIIEKSVHGPEQRAQKQTLINIVNLSLTKEQRKYSGSKVVPSADGAGQPDILMKKMSHAKKKNLEIFSFTEIKKWTIDPNVKYKTPR